MEGDAKRAEADDVTDTATGSMKDCMKTPSFSRTLPLSQRTSTQRKCPGSDTCRRPTSIGKMKNGFGFTNDTKKFRKPEYPYSKCQQKNRLNKSVIEHPTQTRPNIGHQRSASLPTQFTNLASQLNSKNSPQHKQTSTTHRWEVSDMRELSCLPPKMDTGSHNGQYSQSLPAETEVDTSERKNENGRADVELAMDITVSSSHDEDTQFYSGDLDIDTITACDIHSNPLNATPANIPRDFVDSKVPKTPVIETKFLRFTLFKTDADPDHMTEILISHTHQTDTPDGDRFGATLVTFPPSKRFHYYRHFLENVHGPAKSMFIRNNDELVLINSRFTSNLGHEEVLHIFRLLPVDGRTRTQLIIRRAFENTKKKLKQLDWLWIETSALLVPATSAYNEKIEASDVHHKPLVPGWSRVDCNLYKYRLHGLHTFMAIDRTKGIQAVANVTGSTNTVLLREDYTWLEKNDLYTKTALSSQEGSLYLNIDDRGQVSTSAKKQYIHSAGPDPIPFWYEPTPTTQVSDSKQLYLAYNKQTTNFEARPKTFLDKQGPLYVSEFNQIFIKHQPRSHQPEAMDYPDSASAFPSNGSDGDGSDTSDSGLSSTQSSQPASMTSSQNSFDSGNEDNWRPGTSETDLEGGSDASSLGTLTNSIRTPVTPMDALSIGWSTHIV